MTTAKQSIGNQLKKQRENKQLSINDVYQKTKIHPNVLTALEEEKFSQIGNATYIRSFLKKYAAYLGLDTHKISEEFDKIYAKSRHDIYKPQQPIEKKLPVPVIDTERPVKVIKAVLFVILTIVIVVILIRSAARIAKIVSGRLAVSARQVGVAKTAKGKKTKTADNKTAQEKESLQKKAQIQKKTPKTQPARRQDKIPIPAGEKLKLTITATDEVWLEIKADGKTLSRYVLSKGSSEDWEANDSFEIWTGKAEAISLTLNGHDLGKLGEGVKRGVVITREGVKK